MATIPDNPFVLVDGSSYLFRAYHALPPLISSKGQPTGAIYGVVNMLKRLISDFEPQFVAVIFDAKGKTFRHEMFPEYKANRTEMPEDLAVQIEPLHQIIRALGLPLITVPGVEADDVIGTLAVKAHQQNIFTLISTGDKDMAQLVNDNIMLVNTMADKFYDRAGVMEKFQVPPEQIIDYLALVGDTSDNIPGVPKVGPKTAAKWLQTYSSLDGVIANVDNIKGKVGENLKTAIQDLDVYRELVTIKLDIPLDFNVQELKLTPPDMQLLHDMYTELDFKSWAQMLKAGKTGLHKENHAQQFSSPAVSPKAQEKLSTSYSMINTEEAFQQLLAKIDVADVVAMDTETTSLNYMNAELVGISFAIQVGEAFYVPVGHSYPDAPSQLPLEFVLQGLQSFFGNSKIVKVLHNSKYDMHILANYGITLEGKIFDTMLASYVVNSVNRHDLDSLALQLLDHKNISYEDVAGKGAKKVTFDKVGLDVATPYACEDSDICLRLYEIFNEEVHDVPGVSNVFENIEIPLVPVLLAMERRGVLLDRDGLAKQSKELEERLTNLENQSYELAGQKFNMNSPKQLQDILFTELGLPVIKKTPKGQPSTAEPILQELAIDYELPKVILEYRSLSKLKSTYTDKLPEEINTKTGRVHTSYHQAVTSTGRLSSSDPNLQNIPVRTEEGKKIRSAFIAPPGYQILSADYSQIELRIMAHLSEDKSLIDFFVNGMDVHRATAAEVFAVHPDEVTTEQRRKAKAINFGLIYGMSAFGLSRQLGIERSLAEEYMQVYFKRFPGVRDYMQTTREKAAEQGFVETLFGRRLYLPDIKSKQVMVRNAAERAAINAPMQGAQADIIKRAMIHLHSWLAKEHQDVYMIMQVHDELVFEIPNEKVSGLTPHIVSVMEKAAELKVDLVVETGVAANWEQAH